MKTFIVGGTGFLGFYTVKELLKRGHEVSTIALPPMPAADLLPEQVKVTLNDLDQLDDEAVMKMLHGIEGLIFAAGKDDRIVPAAPAYPFFYEGNVVSTQRILKLARCAGVKRAVVFSSYFVPLARKWPELKMTDVHPYVRSRVEQIRVAKETAGSDLSVSFLMLPYIFGSMHGRIPLWKPLIQYLKSSFPIILYPGGGSAMVSVTEVAAAAVRALESGTPGTEYEIASDNLFWEVWLNRLLSFMGKEKPVWTIPNWMVSVGARLMMAKYRMQGKEPGLDLAEFVKVQTRMGELNLHSAPQKLGYHHEDLDLALRETVEACL